MLGRSCAPTAAANKGQDRGNFIWNSIGGCLNAGQSVFVLMVITRVCSLETAGIFSIAFATGNLFMYVGNYGVRNYQVSDLQEKYAFGDYIWHRLVTVFVMLCASAVYTAMSLASGSYSSYKAGCVFAMCCLKAVDCLEEVFEGRYQQRGRLDRSGKLVTVRLLVSIGGMMAALFVTGDLLVSTWIAVLLAILASLVMIFLYRDSAAFRKTPVVFRKILGLMRACFPVCAANFLSFFLTNEPKYAIDALLDETSQACYNFIAMPVFVIQLLNMFMYQPLLIRMTTSYKRGERKAFLSYFGKIVLGLLGIACLVLLAAWFLGIPVLSALYATDLSEYRLDLLIILAGGIFLAFNGFYSAVLTITRAQNIIPFMYLAGCAVSLILTPQMVRPLGIRGAVLSYVFTMALVTGLLTILFAFRMSGKRFTRDNGS